MHAKPLVFNFLDTIIKQALRKQLEINSNIWRIKWVY